MTIATAGRLLPATSPTTSSGFTDDGTIVDLFTELTLGPSDHDVCTGLRRTALTAVSKHLESAITEIRRRNATTIVVTADIASWPHPITRADTTETLRIRLLEAHELETQAQVERAERRRGRTWRGCLLAGVLGFFAAGWTLVAGSPPAVPALLAAAGIAAAGCAVWIRGRTPTEVTALRQAARRTSSGRRSGSTGTPRLPAALRGT
ncbi:MULTISPECIES: hypothetical protein [Catenuloplanes]|uniref:Uncharacterized protein n=1 Tax=Catenuloplanes niger TaxID=587534 RepID=A0AAE4CWB5_9ACTN|nr:hypothetical protein [Catenuloplanes niger]MDR7327070.1 hypothetical protein [Catenuloplanes niger]